MSMLDQVNSDGEFVVSDEVRTPQKAIAESYLFAFDTGSESYVQQSFAEECDINNIVRKYMDVGAPLNERVPMYGDFSEVPDYQGAFEIVERAAASFASLPSEVRTRFGNDPGLMMDFLADERNLEESYQLGLRVKTPPSDTDRLVDAIKASAPPPAASSSQ